MTKPGKKEDEDAALAELAMLAARPRRVTVYTWDKETDAKIEKSVRVEPMTLEVCTECAAAWRPIVEVLPTTISLDDLPMLMVEHETPVREMVALATGESIEYLGQLPLDQYGELVTIVFEVNHDFFVRRVGPTFKALAYKMFGGAGPTLSTVSLNTGT